MTDSEDLKEPTAESDRVRSKMCEQIIMVSIDTDLVEPSFSDAQ